MALKFFIEQLAFCPPDPKAAKELLTEMGAGDWANDHVIAAGDVRGHRGSNEADLAFEYEMLRGARELEVLHYTRGDNWMAAVGPCVSHIGMHCAESTLAEWKKFFAARGVPIVQEVNTSSHSNPAIAGMREYHYCIFGTRDILGVDTKFICRKFI